MRVISKLAVAALVVVGMISNAGAILITPTDAEWAGSIPGNLTADTVEALIGASSQLSLAYKDVKGSGDAGSLFASSYTTAYFNSPTDPRGATITYDGGASISGSQIYLVVKDGDQQPVWYLFDISGWNGTETIGLQNFWTAGGAVSQVAIITAGRTSVPDASSTMMLLGIGMVAIEGLRRRIAR